MRRLCRNRCYRKILGNNSGCSLKLDRGSHVEIRVRKPLLVVLPISPSPLKSLRINAYTKVVMCTINRRKILPVACLQDNLIATLVGIFCYNSEVIWNSL